MRRIRTIPVLTGALTLTAVMAAVVPTAAHAAVACNEPALVAAITAANASGGGNVVLTPSCTYTLTAQHSADLNGPNGLPVITTVITLTGNTNTITRSALLPFRIIKVAATGNLTVKGNITISNGLAALDGGGILNFGAVTLTASALTGNTALGVGGGLANPDIAAPAAGATATFTSSTVSGNSATLAGGGIYNGLRGTLTATTSFINGTNNTLLQGGGVAAVNSTATSLTSTPVSTNNAVLGAGGIYRVGGTMTITTSPISGNTPNNCVGSVPAVPGCTG